MNYEELKEIFKKYINELKESTGSHLYKMWMKNELNIIPRWIVIQLCDNRTILFKLLREIGLLKSQMKCDCGEEMSIVKRKAIQDKEIWHCKKRRVGERCYGSKSIRCNSWFVGSHLSIETILIITYEVLNKTTRQQINQHYGVSLATITEWTYFIKETLVDYLENHSESIGGEGVIVEIDESQFSKRKYERGRYVEGQWVLGGIERDRGRMFLVAMHDRTATSLTNTIKEWVLPGTTIYTNCWAAYDRLGDEGYTHLTVNHKINFVDPITGAHTNTIKSMWRHIKNFTPMYVNNQESFTHFLGHFLFDRLCKTENEDIFLCFLNILRQIDWSSVVISKPQQTEDDESSNTSPTKRPAKEKLLHSN